jgi:hypothetical protein
MQDAERIIVETPNHYKAYIKPKLTYGEVKQIKRSSMSSVQYDPKTQGIASIDTSKLLDVQDVAMKLFLVKLLDPQGNELPDPVSKLDGLDAEDGEAIEEKISELTKELELTKKKVTI